MSPPSVAGTATSATRKRDLAGGTKLAVAVHMQNISNEDLGSVIGGTDSGAVCTKPSDSKPPQQFFENSHAGPSANDRIKDATNTIYTAANWPANNTAVNKTFTTTICRFRQTGQIAHVYIESAASTAQWSGLVVTWNG